MGESRTQNSKKNITASYYKQIVSLVLQFASRTVFIYTLGATYLGMGSLFKNILQFLSLADLGFTTAMAYSYYKPLAENDQDRIAALVNFYKSVYNIIAAVILALGLCCIPLLKYLINTETDIPHVTIYYIFYLLNTVVGYLCVYKTTLLTAAQKGYILTRIQLIVNVVITFVQIICLLLFKNYILYLTILVIGTLLQNIYPSMKVDKLFPYIKKRSYLDVQEKASMFKNIKAVFIYKVSSKLVTSTDNILISMLVGTTVVGYYSNYYMIIDSITLLVTAIFTSLTASVGNMLASKDVSEEKQFQVFRIEQTAAGMISVFTVACFALLANDFISLWLGKSFVLDTVTVWAIALNFFLTCYFQPLWSFREASGLYRQTRYVNVATAAVNVFLSVALGLKFGIAGILVATPIAKLATYFWYEPPLLYKTYFKASPRSYYKKIVLTVATIAVVSMISLFCTKNLMVDSWLMWLGKAVIVGTIACIGALVSFGWTNEFRTLLNKYLIRR